MCYSNEKLSSLRDERKSQGLPKLTTDEITTITATFNSDFKFLCQEDQQKYIDIASDKRAERASASSAGQSDGRPYNGDRRWNLCSKRDPICLDAVSQILNDNAASSNRGGVSATATKLREGLADSVFITDAGDITPETKVKYYTHCGAVHKGLCRFDDAPYFAKAFDLAKRIDKVILDSKQIEEGDLGQGSSVF